MNRFRKYLAIFAFSLLILSLPIIANAQRRDNRNNRRNDDNYGRNNRRDDNYGRNNRNNRNLNSLAKNLKNSSKQFEKKLDRELDRSRYDDSRREDRINEIAERFADAADNFNNEYDNRRDYNDSADEARRVLAYGQQLDNALRRARVSRNLRRDWSKIQGYLRELASAYNYNNRSYNQRDDRYNRDQRRNRDRDQRRRNNRYPY